MSPIGSQAARFIGRRAELDRLEHAFAGNARLVSVCGPAGMGKTRLAVEYGRRRRHAGGAVWLCELETARTTAELIAHIARAVDVPVPVAADSDRAAAQLGRALMNRGRALFLLDNVEQVVAPCAALLRGWLQAPGEAQFLVTSRERLGLDGEGVHELEPLSLPAGGADVADSDAVRLLVDRAEAVGRPLELASAPEAIAELVRQLDGIPLAIELAAAQLDLLGVADVLDRLPRRLSVLASDEAGRPSRQRTLRGALQWSWELIDEAEQTALAESSVFRGGFDLAAAEQVLGVDDVARVLRSLVRKSLLVSRHTRERLRFGHYESIRVFAAERLHERPQVAAVATGRHRDHYLARAARWWEAIDRNGAPEALLGLAGELDNLRAIWERAIADADARSALDAALALDAVYTSRGPLDSQLAVMDRTIELCAGELSPEQVARVRRARGNALRVSGRLERALPDLEQALAEASPGARPAVLADMGVLHHQRRDMDAAAACYRRALDDARAAGERRTEARTLGNLAAIAHDMGRFEDAEGDYRRALAGFADIGDRRHEGIFLANLALLERELGRSNDAVTHFRRSLELLEEVGDRRLIGITLANLGALEHIAGNLEEARASLERALELLRAMGELRSEALCLGRLGAVLAALDDADTALAHIDAAERLLERIGDEVAAAAVRLARGFIELAHAARARIGNEPERADALIAAVRQRIAVASSGEPPLVRQSDDARSFIHTLEAALSRLDPQAPSSSEPALQVGPEARWFRVPGGEPQDLRRRKALRLILLHLTEVRRRTPGAGVAVEELQRAGWPGEKITPQAGANRVYVTLNKLRNLGLEGILVRGEDGYLLDPTVRIERVATDWRAMLG